MYDIYYTAYTILTIVHCYKVIVHFLFTKEKGVSECTVQ